MPEPYLYLEGFNLRNGMRIGNYQITTLDINHVPIIRYDTYSYPTHIVVQWIENGNPTLKDVENFYKEFNEMVKNSKVITSHYGKPYLCYFQYPKNTQPKISYSIDFKLIDMIYLGQAKRINNINVTKF